MKVTIEELQEVWHVLSTHLRESNRAVVELDHDYYWSIEKEEMYDPSRDPASLTLGQLSDDWNELQKIRSGTAPPIGYALVWLSSILRAVGEKTLY
jgi:hypothetical protein